MDQCYYPLRWQNWTVVTLSCLVSPIPITSSICTSVNSKSRGVDEKSFRKFRFHDAWLPLPFVLNQLFILSEFLWCFNCSRWKLLLLHFTSLVRHHTFRVLLAECPVHQIALRCAWIIKRCYVNISCCSGEAAWIASITFFSQQTRLWWAVAVCLNAQWHGQNKQN